MAKIFNKCPICGGRLEYSALMQFTKDYQIQIDKKYLQKIVDEKLKSIELDIQAIRNKAIDDVMEKCEIQSRVICDAEQQIEYYGLSIRELRNIVAGLKQESEAKNEK